jgi:hypothetical protein
MCICTMYIYTHVYIYYVYTLSCVYMYNVYTHTNTHQREAEEADEGRALMLQRRCLECVLYIEYVPYVECGIDVHRVLNVDSKA